MSVGPTSGSPKKAPVSTTGSNPTTHTGVGTGAPLRRNVVRRT